MSTFEGPVMSIRAVNALSHYTDWTVGHACTPAPWGGWASSPSVRCDWLVPVLWKKKQIWSQRLIEWHFWIATLGIVLYITAMWVSGIMQGLMWRCLRRAWLPPSTPSSRRWRRCTPITSSASWAACSTHGCRADGGTSTRLSPQARRREAARAFLCAPRPSRPSEEGKRCSSAFSHALIERNGHPSRGARR